MKVKKVLNMHNFAFSLASLDYAYLVDVSIN